MCPSVVTFLKKSINVLHLAQILFSWQNPCGDWNPCFLFLSIWSVWRFFRPSSNWLTSHYCQLDSSMRDILEFQCTGQITWWCSLLRRSEVYIITTLQRSYCSNVMSSSNNLSKDPAVSTEPMTVQGSGICSLLIYPSFFTLVASLLPWLWNLLLEGNQVSSRH